MEKKKRLVPVRWWVAFWLFVSYIIWYLDRSNISVTAKHIMEEYHWNAAQFGAVMSLFFIGYGVTQIPAGWLADKYGGSRVINVGTIWWSIFTMLTPFGGTVVSMAIVRFLMGLGEGVNAPAHVSITTQWMPRREYGRASGLYLLGVPLGIMITMPTAAWITNTFGWRWVFYSFGLIGFLWAAIWAYYGRNTPEEHPSISKDEIELIRQDQDPGMKIKGATDWKGILASRNVWGTVASYFCVSYCMYLYLSWLPGYLMMSRGFSFNKTATSAMIPWICALFASLVGGVVCDKLSHKFGRNIGRKYMIYTGFIGVAIFTAMAGYTSSDKFVILYLSLAVGSLFLTYPSFYAIPMDISAKDSGVIYGLINTFGTIAGAVAPTTTGIIVVLSKNHWEYALYAAASIAVLGAVAMLFVNIRKISDEKIACDVQTAEEIAV